MGAALLRRAGARGKQTDEQPEGDDSEDRGAVDEIDVAAVGEFGDFIDRKPEDRSTGRTCR